MFFEEARLWQSVPPAPAACRAAFETSRPPDRRPGRDIMLSRRSRQRSIAAAIRSSASTGEPCVVEADIFRDGDHVLHAVIKWRPKGETQFSESPMVHVDNDRWRGEFPLDRNDRYFFTIEAWTDLFASWERGFRKKAEAGRDVASDLLEGIALIEAAGRRAKDADRTAIDAALERLRALGEPRHAVAIVSDRAVARPDGAPGRSLQRDRVSAVAGSSGGPATGALRRLVRDVSALARRSSGARCDAARGRAQAARNSRPRLRRRVPRADSSDRPHASQGAQQLAHSAAPTVPAAPGRSAARPAAIPRSSRRSAASTISIISSWPRGASGWKSHSTSQSSARPTIPGCASIPNGSAIGPTARSSMPRIRPRNIRISTRSTSRRRRPGSDGSAKGSRAVLDRPRRADFPGRQSAHQAGCSSGIGLSRRCSERHPDTIFLAEAFTRPKVMMALAKAGFTQSYTYFTWRNTKTEFD